CRPFDASLISPIVISGRDGREFNLGIRCISNLWIEQIMISSPHRNFLKGIIIPPPGSHTSTGCLVSQFWSFRKRLHRELLRRNSELAPGRQDCPVTLFQLWWRGVG